MCLGPGACWLSLSLWLLSFVLMGLLLWPRVVVALLVAMVVVVAPLLC